MVTLNTHHFIAVLTGLLYKMKKKKKVYYTSQIGSEGKLHSIIVTWQDQGAN